MKIFPYTLPAWITLAFVFSIYTGQFWFGPLLIPLVTFFNRFAGSFTQQEIIPEYYFFHHNKSMGLFKSFNAVFFILFHTWVFWYLTSHELTVLQLILFIYSVVILASNLAISLAHDLMHSSRSFDRFYATVLLVINGFFYLESDHLYIHHRYVSTSKDPASARLNEGLYSYLCRSVWQRMTFVFGIGDIFPPEKKTVIVAGNIARFLVCVLYAGLAFVVGKQVFICVISQFIFVTLIYEVITYIQHYALSRENDTQDDVGLFHSWNCYYKISTYLHFMVAVHSIHHLKHEPLMNSVHDAGPSYPKPFTKMVLIAFLPGYWFKLMNTKVEEVKKQMAN